MTAYNTVFNTTGEPDGFGYIFAVDWFMDRGRTLVNVTGDCFVTGTISSICPLDIIEAEELAKDMERQSQSQLGFGIAHSQGSGYVYADNHFGDYNRDLYSGSAGSLPQTSSRNLHRSTTCY